MENIDNEFLDKIEIVGFNFLAKKDYLSAIAEFEKMLKYPMTSLRHVQVLKNILGCYVKLRSEKIKNRDFLVMKELKEYYRKKAIETCEDALKIIEINNLIKEEKDGKSLLLYFRRYHVQLNTPPSIFNPSADFASFVCGSWTGFFLFKIAFNVPLIYQIIGGLIGLFFLSRIYFLFGESFAKLIIRIEGNKEEVSDSWINFYQGALFLCLNYFLFKDDYLLFWNSLIKKINEIMS